MIYTDEFFALEDATDELIAVLNQSRLMQAYRNSHQAINQAEDIMELLNNFAEKKRTFEKIEPYGKHAPDFTQKRRELRQAKRQLDLAPPVMEFRALERDLQDCLDHISYAIAQTVSKTIKVDAGNPFFEFADKGCGGSCHVG